MEKIRKTIHFENPDNDIFDELYDSFNEVDFFYNENFIRFHGTPERFQELMRACDANGLVIKAQKLS